MFKRQFYALEHSNRDGDSASSSSSSSLATASDGEGGPDVEDDGAWPASEHESDASSEEEVTKTNEGATSVQRKQVSSDGEAEDVAEGSDGEADDDASDIEPQESLRKRRLLNQWADAVDDDEKERVLEKYEGKSVLRVGKVFKCRLCPKIVCLSEETMDAHLSSKRHARSLKQLAAGKLKVQLDSDGEEEEEGETHAERFARTIGTAQEAKMEKRKRDSGRQRQQKRRKRKALLEAKQSDSTTEVLPDSQPTAALKGKTLVKKKKPSQSAPVPTKAKSGSARKHVPPLSKNKNSFSKTKDDRTPKA